MNQSVASCCRNRRTCGAPVGRGSGSSPEHGERQCRFEHRAPPSRGRSTPKGPAADAVATLWWVMLAVGTAVFLLVVVLLVVPIWRRRRLESSTISDDRGEVPPALVNRWVIGLGVVMPAVLLIAVLVMSVSTMRTVSHAAPSDSVVHRGRRLPVLVVGALSRPTT